jgi:hypothetical protein
VRSRRKYHFVRVPSTQEEGSVIGKYVKQFTPNDYTGDVVDLDPERLEQWKALKAAKTGASDLLAELFWREILEVPTSDDVRVPTFEKTVDGSTVTMVMTVKFQPGHAPDDLGLDPVASELGWIREA